jgi:hypothetical protein
MKLKPKPFRGESTENIEVWLRHFWRVADSRHWDDRRRYLYAVHHLEGKAAERVDLWEIGNPEATFIDLCQFLHSAYGGHLTRGAAIQGKWMGLRQRAGEKVSLFLDRAEAIASQLGRHVPAEELRLKLLESMDKNILDRVSAESRFELARLKWAAQQEEDLILRRKAESNRHHHSPDPQRKEKSHKEKKHGHRKPRSESPEVVPPARNKHRPEERNSPGPSRSRTDYQQRHRQKSYAHGKPELKKNPSHNAEGELICYKCSKTGHFVNQCPLWETEPATGVNAEKLSRKEN